MLDAHALACVQYHRPQERSFVASGEGALKPQGGRPRTTAFGEQNLKVVTRPRPEVPVLLLCALFLESPFPLSASAPSRAVLRIRLRRLGGPTGFRLCADIEAVGILGIGDFW